MDRDFERLTGRKFSKEIVEIDGREFVDCHFEDCVLTYSGGGLFLFDNSPIQGCRFEMEGAALNTLMALSHMYEHGMGTLAETLIKKIRNPFDDTVQ